jgi:iron(III) transport system substrate-binding protein
LARGARPIAALLAALALSAAAQPPGHRDIYMYRGADRDKVLLEKARAEGSVAFYTTLTVTDARALADAFQRKYGIRVMAWRGGSEKIVQRAVAEARAGRFEADAFEMNGPQMEILHREKLLEEFYSPVLDDFPPTAIPKHREYVADRLAFFVAAWNTNAVKPGDVPRGYQDTLDPKWRGKLGLEAADVIWFAAVAKAMGEERGLAFFRQLAAQKPQLRAGHILIAELVASGEIPLTLTAYNNNIETLRKKGAPVQWKPLAPAFGRPSSIGLARNAAHPHAALAFVEFVLSREGQEILARANRVPASRAVASPLNDFPYELIDPAIQLDEWDKWSRLWSQLFLGGREVRTQE